MQKQQQTSLKNALSKEQVQRYFNTMFQDQSNTFCFQCDRKCKQWVDQAHAIFLCLNCAALYKQLKWAVGIKSISLDLWSKKQLDVLMNGGNRRFKEFLGHYQLQQFNYKHKLKTKAAQYYRQMLLQNPEHPSQPPIRQIGQQFTKDEIPLSQMSPQQIMDYTKEKAIWFGSKTKQLGSKAYLKIQKKVSSGQLKEDAKNAAKQVKSKAKALWGFAMSKVKELQGDKQPKPVRQI